MLPSKSEMKMHLKSCSIMKPQDEEYETRNWVRNNKPHRIIYLTFPSSAGYASQMHTIVKTVAL